MRFLRLPALAGWLALRSGALFGERDRTWARIQREGVLRVGMDASYPPFEVVDAEGRFFGYDVDLARTPNGSPAIETVLRDGPLGEGSVQWYVDANHEEHYFTIYEGRADLHDRLRDFAVFDVVANNTDRKSGHVLIDDNDHLWGIDHGLCFGADFKLRTVVWEFGGEPIADELVDAATRIAKSVPLDIAALLADDEVVALQERANWVVEHREFPVDESGRRYPWPLV